MDKNKKIAQLIIARLDGEDVHKKFQYYQSLVKKGIGGFIIFGGKLNEVSKAIEKLQKLSEVPLFISSDLERGLGQQIEGGTLFPPAMAIAQAINPVRNRFSNGVNPKNKDDINLLRNSINIIAQEAKAVGINVIFSPVLDINTNPKNPIISVRAFGENPEKVSWFGIEFIKGFQKHGIIACAKHFPGHGNTSVDSHIKLPVVKADMKRLKDVELYPFREAIKSKVKMIMVGHLKVPAMDSKFPSTLSEKTIKGFLRDEMKFKGLVVTDAMNMQAIKYPEEKACLMALKAGADLILHPSEPERIIDYFSSRWNEIMPRVEESYQRILKAKKELCKVHPVRKKVLPELSNGGLSSPRPRSAKRGGWFTVHSIGKKLNWETAKELTQKSIKINLHSGILLHPPFPRLGESPVATKGEIFFPSLAKRGEGRFYKTISFKVAALEEEPIVLIIDDDDCKSGMPFVKALKKRYKKIKSFYVDNKTPLYPHLVRGEFKGGGKPLIIAVFSKISAWKSRSGLSRKLKTILKKAVKASRHTVIAGFCSPYLLKEFKAGAIIEAYSDSKQIQEIVGEILSYP